MSKKTPLVLCILDGWGVATTQDKDSKNAIMDANPEFYKFLCTNYPNSLLQPSGKHVGLPEGQMGNSEVGHMTIGSGRIIYQDLPRINKAMESDELANNALLQEVIKKLKISDKTCHIAGLVSDGGVHSHINHIIYLASLMKNNGIKVCLHVITDGRDTSPNSALSYIDELPKDIQISTISGRYYAMDRDKRYDRTKAYYDVITTGSNNKNRSAHEVVKASYSNELFDEFIQPESLKGYSGMENGDAFIMANFRADRARQIISALGDADFIEFDREKIIIFTNIITMTSYSEQISHFTKTLFPQIQIKNSLAEVLSDNDKTQYHIAETEKYAHVTFFFNAGKEAPVVGEDRRMIPSPKVDIYDDAPAMSAITITKRLTRAINCGKYDFILVNYANADMVGHTGNYRATISAIKILDACLEAIYRATLKMKGTMIVTADHGNAEQMYDSKKKIEHTAHTTNPVPFILIGDQYKGIKLKNGGLVDIAPTILSLMNITIPKEMTGENLLEK